MILPSKLPYVTLYLPDADSYYEFAVSSSQIRFALESFYQRESISAKKDTLLRGFRLDMDINLDQTIDHETMRAFWNQLYAESSQEAYLYLRKEDDIEPETGNFQVTLGSFLAKTTASNTISRHGYEMSFTGVFPAIGIGLAYIITNDDFFYLTNDGDRYIVQLNPY